MYGDQVSLTLTECNIHSNGVSVNGGGGLAVASGTVALYSCNISSNTDAPSGGALYIYSGTIKLTLCSIIGNGGPRTLNGGGVAILGGTVTLTSCNIHGNKALLSGGYGGGLWDSQNNGAGNLTMVGGLVQHNEADVAEGKDVFLAAGASFTYVLPAPPGHYLDGAGICQQTNCCLSPQGCVGGKGVGPCAQQLCKPEFFDRVIADLGSRKVSYGFPGQIPSPCPARYWGNSSDPHEQQSFYCGGPW